MIILGIDPGYRRVGYGLIKKNSGLTLLAAGLLKIDQLPEGRFLDLKKELDALIKKFKPEIMAVEKLFFLKNQKTGLAVAEARGIIILTSLENNLKIREYAPTEVKMTVGGYGRADKKAVAKMVKLILNEPRLQVIDDASDALALAIAASRERD